MNCWPSGKYVNLLYMYSILGRGSFCFNYCLNSAWHGGDQFVALLRWYGSPGFFDSGLQVICIVGSGVSHLLLTIPHRFSMGFRSGEFAGQSSTVTPWSLNQLWYLWQCGQVPSPAGKWNQHLHKACQQKEAWSALKFPGRWLRWLWTSENTVDHWLWKLHTGLQATWILCLSYLSPDSGTLISKWNAKFTFIWKEDFGPLSNSPVLFLHSPGKTLLMLSLVQKWLGSPFPEDVWAW